MRNGHEGLFFYANNSNTLKKISFKQFSFSYLIGAGRMSGTHGKNNTNDTNKQKYEKRERERKTI